MVDFIGIYDNVLNFNACNNLIDYFETNSNKQPGTCGIDDVVDIKSKDSTDLVCSFDNYSSHINLIFDGLVFGTNEYVKQYSVVERVDPWCLHNLFNIQRYYPNQGYHTPHCESDGFLTNHRILAWMFYLNTVTDGGQTRFPAYDLNIDAVEGRLLIWPAYFTHVHHGILSPTQTKYIATGWYTFFPK